MSRKPLARATETDRDEAAHRDFVNEYITPDPVMSLKYAQMTAKYRLFEVYHTLRYLGLYPEPDITRLANLQTLLFYNSQVERPRKTYNFPVTYPGDDEPVDHKVYSKNSNENEALEEVRNYLADVRDEYDEYKARAIIKEFGLDLDPDPVIEQAIGELVEESEAPGAPEGAGTSEAQGSEGGTQMNDPEKPGQMLDNPLATIEEEEPVQSDQELPSKGLEPMVNLQVQVPSHLVIQQSMPTAPPILRMPRRVTTTMC